MKLSILSLITLAIMISFYSCNQGSSTKSSKSADTTFTTSCYIAVDGKDTARLTLKNFSKKTGGTLVFNFDKKDKNEGTIDGTFKGDTLFVNYTFRVGAKPAWFVNPLALLKKDGKLLLGIGKMETTLGRTYFKKDEPIDFEGGRFIFEPADCKNK